ncbi:MAG: aminoacyl-tRNA hydrolase [Bacilli bacterium]
MKLIVGLGNVGKIYDKTKHNIGFFFLDNYIKEQENVTKGKKFDGEYYQITKNNEKIILLKPQKYMNLSGEVVIKYINYFNIDIKDILIISDDLDLNVGNIKLKESGSSGGHNGLKNIELNIGTTLYKRLKIGIGKDTNYDTKDYVLSKITLENQTIYDDLIPVVNNIIDDFLLLDFTKVMSKYNQKNTVMK